MSKEWFITGASSGLGRHLTEVALSEGDAMTAAVRRPDALRDLAEAYGGRLTVEALDVTSSQDVSRVVARCLVRGRIDGGNDRCAGAAIDHAEPARPHPGHACLPQADARARRWANHPDLERRRTDSNPRQQSIPCRQVGT